VRGKGVVIQNLTVTGGSQGIHVNRGSNAMINNNVIQGTNGNGVLIDELAFAVIIKNTIESNPGSGIFVTDQSIARIGFNADSESSASANTIQSNALGIVISHGSSARVIGNAIQNNSGDGFELGENSLIQLGEDSGASIYESANTTASANTGFGVRCTSGGLADGRLGSLTGMAGVTSFDGSCTYGLAP